MMSMKGKLFLIWNKRQLKNLMQFEERNLKSRLQLNTGDFFRTPLKSKEKSSSYLGW